MNDTVIIQRIRKGLPIIVVDDEHREDEADLFFSAQNITIPWMAFMIRHTSGIVCAPMIEVRARALGLSPLMNKSTSHYGCKFTMPVDVNRGTITGVSAHDRVLTVRRLQDSRAKPNDFGRPGHVFPLIAHPKLLQGRRGHTEAAVALLQQADLSLTGVIAELMNDDGTMMRASKLKQFAKRFKIPILRVQDI